MATKKKATKKTAAEPVSRNGLKRVTLHVVDADLKKFAKKAKSLGVTRANLIRETLTKAASRIK